MARLGRKMALSSTTLADLGDCLRTAVYPMALIAPAAIGVIAIMRGDVFGRRADLHGSARWATSRDVRRAGLLPQRTVVRRLGRYLLRIRSQTHSAGIYLARWEGSSRIRFLRDTGPGHVLVFAPTRSGKGAGVVVPTLLTWPHSALIHDLKGENWALTAGWRKQMGHVCLKFDPTDTTGTSVKYNPLEQVRLRTEHEAEDVQNIVHMIVDPDGRGLNDHWVKTGAALLTGTILHVLYAEPNKTLRGVAGVLSDPSAAMPETIQRMLSTEHDPDGSMRWRSYRGEPIRTHPIVAESMRELLNKSENERSGVFSTAMSFLSLYRDPVVAANTERSEFRISDLMNHDRPVSLYLVVPLSSRDRLRPLIRLILNQIVRTLTTTMNYRDGKATADYKHQLSADAGRISGTRPAGSFLRRARVDRGLRTSRLSHRPGLEPDSCGIRSRRSDHEQLSHTSRVHPEPRRNRALTLTNGRRGDRQARAAHLLELWNFNFGTRDLASAVDHRRSNAPP